MQIKSGLSLKIVALGILLIISFVLSNAQESKSESSQAQKTQELKHEVSVTLKLIQVFVTDKDGNPVTGLKPENFVVFDNFQRTGNGRLGPAAGGIRLKVKI